MDTQHDTAPALLVEHDVLAEALNDARQQRLILLAELPRNKRELQLNLLRIRTLKRMALDLARRVVALARAA